MKRSWVLGAVLLAGCASSGDGSRLAMINGHYYIGGDAACSRYKPDPNGNRILCLDAQGKPTNFRTPLSDQELLAYRQNQVAYNQPTYTYQPAPITPNVYRPMNLETTSITPPGGNHMTCISTGFYTSCR